MKHHSMTYAWLFAGALTVACGSDDGSPTHVDETGGGPSVSETGGTGPTATGGNSASTGGNSASTGGNSASTGGNSASTGGNSASTGGNSASTGGNSASTGGTSTGDVLDKLSVKKSDAPVTDSLTRHPLQKEFTTYQKRSELYLSGVTYNPDGHFDKSNIDIRGTTGKHQFLLDDKFTDDKSADDNLQAPKGYKPLFSSTGDQTWTTYPSASGAASLHGDGRESAVVLYRNPTTGDTFLRMIRRSATATSGYEEKEFSIGNYKLTPYADYPAYDKLQVAAGDLDNDGVDELALVIGNTLVIEKYNKSTDTFAKLDSKIYGTDAAPHLTTVAVGDVDLESGFEIVVADGVNGASNSCAYYVYSLKQGKLQLKAGGPSSVVMESAQQTDRRGFVTARVAIGDLDGDGMNEIAFAGDADINQIVVSVMKYDSKVGGYDVIASTRKNAAPTNWGDQYLPVLQVFNPEGVTQNFGKWGAPKSLLVYKYILKLDVTSDGSTLTDRWPGLTLGDPWYDKVVAGDFMGKGKEYVAFLSSDNATSLQIWGYESGTFHQIDWIDIDPNPSFPNAASLCAVNIDSDSTIVKYTDKYEMLYSQPQVLAVLAFPPYYDGQDVSNAYTAYGWQVTSDKESATTLGVYAGFSVGFSVETPFWGSASSAEVKCNVDTSLDFTAATTTSWSGTAKKTCMGGDDGGQPCVVFSYTPIDVYYYEVLSSPKADQVGKTMSVQMPRSPRIADATLTDFNSVVSDEFRVPDELEAALTAQLGHPELYPTRSQMLSHFSTNPPLAGYRTLDSQVLEVSAKSRAINELELDTGTSAQTGTEFNLSVGIEAQAVASGVLVGGRAGFHYGYSQSSTVGHNTIIAGGIPGISSSLSATPFNVGLFAYPQKRPDGGDYVVVNYWVEQ